MWDKRDDRFGRNASPWLQKCFEKTEPNHAMEPLDGLVELAGHMFADFGPEAPRLTGQPKP